MWPQRRRVRVCAICAIVFVGAIIASIALAAGCALWSPAMSRSVSVRADAEHPLSQAALQYGTFDTFVFTYVQGFGWQRERLIAANRVPPTIGRLHNYQAGWPLFCLEGRRGRFDAVLIDEALAPLPDWRGVNRNGLTRIPLRPRWGALLLNALLLGMPFYLVIAFREVRRVLRRRSRRCVLCGYDLRGARGDNDTCPECGARHAACQSQTGAPPRSVASGAPRCLDVIYELFWMSTRTCRRLMISSNASASSPGSGSGGPTHE